MKPKRVKLGRKPAMDTRLAISAGFALGCDVPISTVAEISGVSETTILRYMNRGLNDPRCERLQAVARQAEHQNATKASDYK